MALDIFLFPSFMYGYFVGLGGQIPLIDFAEDFWVEGIFSRSLISMPSSVLFLCVLQVFLNLIKSIRDLLGRGTYVELDPFLVGFFCLC